MNALAAVILVLVILRLTDRTKRFLGSVWVPVVTGALGIAAVGLPVVARLRAQLAGYTQGGLIPSGRQAARLVTDLPETLATSIPAWPAAVIVVVALLASKPTRRALMQTWWAWVLLILPTTFSLVFLLTTTPSQPLFERYMFTWIPLLAVVVSAVMSEIPLRRSQQIALVCGAVATVVLIGASALQLASDLSSTERGDSLENQDTFHQNGERPGHST